MKLVKKMAHWCLLTILLAACSGKTERRTTPQAATQETANYLLESADDFNNRMEWWRNARFGMFIHWGPYAVPAGEYKGEQVKGLGEWIMKRGKIPIPEYEAFAKQFDPQKFDADQWARLMKDAGMKYVVITSKHHDGFGLWDSRVSDYDIVDYTPYKKDILKSLSKACKKYGIKFGAYYSIMDWHHPDAQSISYITKEGEQEKSNPEFPRYLDNYLKPQIKELIEQYDIEILWFDGEWVQEYTHEQGQELYQYVRSLKPNILINNRVDKGRKSMQGMNKDDKDYAGDFGTPEQEILEGTSSFDWESCMTMNDTWGYQKNDHNWKSDTTLIHHLVDVAAKGGNYLLNVGPKADGTIPQPSIDRLLSIGEWLKTNGEAIFDTEPLKTTYKQGENIRFTKKTGEPLYYAMHLTRPDNDIILAPVKPHEGTEIYLLGISEPLDWNYSEEKGLEIKVPKFAIDQLGETQAWTFKIRGEEVN